MDDDLVITPEEVRAVARFPHRDLLMLAAVVAALLAARVFAVRGPAPPPPSPWPPFDPATCHADAPSGQCLARLPPELRRVPTPDQYIRWRRVDSVSRVDERGGLDLQEEAALLRLGPDEVLQGLERNADTRIRAALDLLDPWEQLPRLDDASLPPDWLDRRVAVGDWMSRLGLERDWSAEPPGLPSIDPDDLGPGDLSVVWRGAVRRGVEPVLREAAQVLADQRKPLFAFKWGEAAGSEMAEADAARQAADRHRVLGWIAGSLAVVAAGLAVSWGALGPRSVVVGVHSLRIGRRAIPWSEIVRADWDGDSIQVRGWRRAWSLGPRILGPSARSGLATATERALDRARSLPPPDPAALRQLEELRRGM